LRQESEQVGVRRPSVRSLRSQPGLSRTLQDSDCQGGVNQRRL
jgi:hypothetical protein